MAKTSKYYKNLKNIKIVDQFKQIRQDIKNKIKELRKKLNCGEIQYKELISQVFKLNMQLNSLPRNSCPSRVINRCEITYNARGKTLYKHFRMSRYQLRTRINNMQVPGVHKI